MRKIIFISIISLFSFSSCLSDKNESNRNDFNNLKIPQESNNNSSVIICHGEDAFAYHIRFCRGLKNCEASTEEMSKDEAIELGRRPCGFCF